MSMWGLFATGYTVSAFMSWRLVTVVATSMDAKQRQDAIKMFSYIWCGSTVGTGLIASTVKLYELGVLR